MRPVLILSIVFTLLASVGVVVLMSSFSSPSFSPPAFDTERPVAKYVPSNNPPEYSTKRINGTDFILSPYDAGQFGGTLYQASVGSGGPKTLNGWASFDGTSGAIASMLSCSPVQTNAHTGNVIPWVAKDISISNDQTEITLTFRDGLQWSDGHALTVDDLLFTWNVIIQEGLGNPSTRDILLVSGKFPVMRKVAGNKVAVRTTVPYAPLLLNMGQSIAPKHIFEQIIKDKGKDAFGAAWSTQEAEQHPDHFVSCGPWVIEQYVPKERIIFKRNPNYYVINDTNERLPYLDREVMTFAKDGSNLQLLFEQGALHTHYAGPQNLARLQHLKSPKFSLVDLGASDGTNFIALNLNTRNDDNGKPIVNTTVARWFADQRVRQAMNLSVNRRQMVDNVLKGLGTPSVTAFGLNSIYLNKDLESRNSYDPTEAQRLLKEAGFSLNAQGQLFDAKGNRVEFTLTTNSGNSEREATLVQLQHDLGVIGIKVNIQPVEFNTLVDRMKTGQWQTMVMGLSGGSNFEPHQSANVFKSDAALHIFNQRDVGQLKGVPTDRLPFEVQLDTLYEQGTQTMDIEQRRLVYNQVQEILYRESPMIYLFSGNVILAIRDELRNVDVTPLGGGLHNIESIWINKNN